MNEIRREILVSLMHQPYQKFNELWQRNDSSSKFAYHMKILEQEGIIVKEQEKYTLTLEGRKEIAHFDGWTGKKTTTPIPCVMVFILQDGKLLAQKRLKEPHYGVWSVPAGKIEYNQTVFEAAKRELFEETGLEADFTLHGISCAKTFYENDQAYNHHMFLLEGTNIRGKLIPATREGENEWVSVDKLPNMEIYPDMIKMIDIIKNKRFTYLELERQATKTGFSDMTITNEIVF